MTKLEQTLQFLQQQEERLWFWGVERSDDPNFSAELVHDAGLRLDRRVEFPRRSANALSSTYPGYTLTETQSGPLAVGSTTPTRVYAITNADQGAVFSWRLYDLTQGYNCAVSVNNSCVTPGGPRPIENHLTTMAGGAVASDVVWGDAIAGQSNAVQPVLQLADGSYVGNASGAMVAFDASGNVKWTVPGYNPDMATADGGIIADAGGSFNIFTRMYTPGSASTFDATGLATGQLASLPTQSWTGNAYQDGPLGSVLPLPVYLASSYWPLNGANPSTNSTSNFFTKEVTIIGWVDKKAVSVPPASSVNATLVSNLDAHFATCPNTLRNLKNGDCSLITSDIDRQYANAFLIINSANDEPPGTLDPSVLNVGNFRAYNDVRAAINAVNNQITSVTFANPKPVLGHTPDACHSPMVTFFNYILNFEKAEAHPDNGKNGITPSGLKVFQIAEGRVGPEAQAVNMTLNSCASTDPQTGHCNAAVPPVTPYIWSVPLLDLQNQYTVNTQIFPTYYIYEYGKLVKKIPQSALEDFIKLKASSQIKVSDVN
jgi:hypothetical protein